MQCKIINVNYKINLFPHGIGLAKVYIAFLFEDFRHSCLELLFSFLCSKSGWTCFRIQLRIQVCANVETGNGGGEILPFLSEICGLCYFSWSNKSATIKFKSARMLERGFLELSFTLCLC